MEKYFLILLVFTSCSISKNRGSNYLQNEHWSMGESSPGMASGTNYFLYDDGTFKAIHTYSAGHFFKNYDEGTYFYKPKTSQLFLKYKRNKKSPIGETGQKAIQITIEDEEQKYTIITANDWDVNNGMYILYRDISTNEFPARIDDEYGYTLCDTVKAKKQEPSFQQPLIMDINYRFRRQKIGDKNKLIALYKEWQ